MDNGSVWIGNLFAAYAYHDNWLCISLHKLFL